MLNLALDTNDIQAILAMTQNFIEEDALKMAQVEEEKASDGHKVRASNMGSKSRSNSNQSAREGAAPIIKDNGSFIYDRGEMTVEDITTLSFKKVLDCNLKLAIYLLQNVTFIDQLSLRFKFTLEDFGEIITNHLTDEAELLKN